MNELITIAAAADLIRSGVPLAVAGPEVALDVLPRGRWIGGTIPYFMAGDGGVVDNASRVFVTRLPELELNALEFVHYASDRLEDIVARTPDNGFSLTIIPAMSPAHSRFAAEAASYEGAFLKPTVGWISGVHLSELGTKTPKIYDGSKGTRHEDGAVVAHIRLPSDKMPSVEIVNIFEPEDGDVLRFEATGFEVGDCSVNGVRDNLARYLTRRGLEHGRLPLIGDFAGANINVSFQKVDATAGDVKLYAPVFSGVDYRIARPVSNYREEFQRRFSELDFGTAVFSCNCILNFLYGELEGQQVGGLHGPATFGEIGYQLLNQTTVVLRIL
jgi:hypothetical protein